MNYIFFNTACIMVSFGSSLPHYLPLQHGPNVSSVFGKAASQGLRQRQLSDTFAPLFLPQGLRKRQPSDFFSASLPKTRFGLTAPIHSSPHRFETLPIEWPSDWKDRPKVVEGYTITEATIRKLFENAAKQASMAVKQIPSHDSEDGFGASAVVMHGTQHSTISDHNNKVPRLDEGYRAYCAEVKTLLNAAAPNGSKGFIPLMVVVNDEAPNKLGVRYAPCGPCLNEIRSAVLGTHPTARMSPDSLIAFVDTLAGKPKIVIRSVKQLFPIKAVTSHSNTSIWDLTFNISPRAQRVFSSLPNRWLFKLAIRMAIAAARWRAKRAEKQGLVNNKGPAIGGAILKKTWVGYRFISGSNAYTNGRSYAPPFQNIMEHLPTRKRTQLLGGVVMGANPTSNVANLGDMDLLAYTAKNKDALIITVNGPTVSIKTYLDYVPYPYHRAHHTKKPAPAGF